MAVKIPIDYSTEFTSHRSADATFSYLCDLKTSIPSNFRGLERFEEKGPNHYVWTFQKLAHSGYEFQIILNTQTRTVGTNRLEASSIPGPETSRIDAFWEVTPSKSGSRVRFQAKLEFEAPLPGFLKAVIAPIAQREFAKFFDQYSKNAHKALAT